MSRIKKVFYFDKKNTQEIASFLNNGKKDSWFNSLKLNPLALVHQLLPLKYKFLPESYILKDDNIIKGFITVAPTRCPLKQMEIHKLLFEENNLANTAELVQYVVSRYKAMGTTSFIVRIDDFLPELIKLFISRCGFSQISYEKLWLVENAEQYKYDKKLLRSFKNSDAPAVASLYNDSLLPHFRTLLGKDNLEFKEVLCKGLSYYTEYKYVLDNKQSGNIDAYISIQTIDNENYILDIVKTCWNEIDINKIITFAYYQISKRKKNFSLFVKTKKYTQYGEKEEQDFMQQGYKCVQNRIVLTNSSAKIIQEVPIGKFNVIEKFYGGVSANTTCCR